MKEDKEPVRYTRAQVAMLVVGSMVLQRVLVVACAKAAAFYAARGDERQANRFSRWARQLAHTSQMYGELDPGPTACHEVGIR